MSAEAWRGIGRTLGERHAAHLAEYAAIGLGDPAVYRRAFVRGCWPNVGAHIKRYVREGFQQAGTKAI